MRIRTPFFCPITLRKHPIVGVRNTPLILFATYRGNLDPGIPSLRSPEVAGRLNHNQPHFARASNCRDEPFLIFLPDEPSLVSNGMGKLMKGIRVIKGKGSVVCNVSSPENERLGVQFDVQPTCGSGFLLYPLEHFLAPLGSTPTLDHQSALSFSLIHSRHFSSP